MSRTITGYYWQCRRCQTNNPAQSQLCRECGVAKSAPQGPQPAVEEESKRQRRWITRSLLGVAVVVIVVLAAQIPGMVQGIREVQSRNMDAADLLSDGQLGYLAETETLGSCDAVRARMGVALQIIASDGYLDDTYVSTPFGERLNETAEKQLDTLRCGG